MHADLDCNSSTAGLSESLSEMLIKAWALSDLRYGVCQADDHVLKNCLVFRRPLRGSIFRAYEEHWQPLTALHKNIIRYVSNLHTVRTQSENAPGLAMSNARRACLVVLC